MILLNFAHPLTPTQLEQLHARIGAAPDRIQDVRVQLDLEQPFDGQIVAMLDSLGISPVEWQSGGWLILLPSLNYAAAILLAELHGRMGHFPTILRLRPVAGAIVTGYDLAEVVNLEVVRAQARTRR